MGGAWLAGAFRSSRKARSDVAPATALRAGVNFAYSHPTLCFDGSATAQAGRSHKALVARLDPADNFGLVTFDDVVEVAVPAGPLAEKEQVRHLIRSLHPGATPNLSGGLLRGAQEARRAKGDRGADAAAPLRRSPRTWVSPITPSSSAPPSPAHTHGVSSSTIGLGLGNDEALLTAIARGGQGNTHFAEEGDTAGAAVASEVEHLLEQVVQAASLTVRPRGAVEAPKTPASCFGFARPIAANASLSARPSNGSSVLRTSSQVWLAGHVQDVEGAVSSELLCIGDVAELGEAGRRKEPLALIVILGV